MEIPSRVECYEVWRGMKSHSRFKTDDGIEVRFFGSVGNPRSQTIELSKEEGMTVSYKEFWGSEGIARALYKHRNENHDHPKGSNRDLL